MSTTPRTDAATLTEPFPVREIGFEVVKAKDMAAMERELNAAITFIKELNATKNQHGRIYRARCGRFLATYTTP
jgi:hypothetical protein